MCTVVLLHRPGHPWPLLLAANRDERVDRPWLPPAPHWPELPDVVGGLDRLAGGSWLAAHARGLVAAVLNRAGSLGLAPGKRSRGELVLRALRHRCAEEAASALLRLDPAAYRPFNLVLADRTRAFWLRHAGAGPITCAPLPEGLSMFTAGERDDPRCPRIRRHRSAFAAHPPEAPASGDWRAWAERLGSHRGAEEDPMAAMCVHGPGGFGTVCAAIIALPAGEGRPLWWQANGPPHRCRFEQLGWWR